MKVSDIMTRQVVKIHPEESVEVAARILERYNIGLLPVCSAEGALCGVITDRDLVTRCVAVGKSPAQTPVRQIMSNAVRCASPNMEVGTAAHLMGRCQVRRLPVVENGVLCGVVSLGDMASCPDSVMNAADALSDITENIREMD